jgi:large subunit ribosomal protein L23
MEKKAGHIVISPRITEKGSYLSTQGAYVFNVAKDANKMEIARAIHSLYKVMPRKVTVVTVPTKKVFTRGTNKFGTTAKGRKAYVYLKKGETIEVF